MSTSIYETSVWPCMCQDMFWSLEDDIEHIGVLYRNDSDSIEYTIDTRGLPPGRTTLHTFTGIRDITIDFSQWPRSIADKITDITLILQDRAIQTMEKKKFDETMTFSIFTRDHFLPLFVVDVPLILRINLLQDMTPSEQMDLPRQVGNCKGLFFRVLDPTRPIFIAGCTDSVLTWNGSSLMILQKASEDRRYLSSPTEDRKKQYFDQDSDSDNESLDLPSIMQSTAGDLEGVAKALGIVNDKSQS